jgi:hypothetical protein
MHFYTTSLVLILAKTTLPMSTQNKTIKISLASLKGQLGP